MLSCEQIEEVLPSPIMVEICCDGDDFEEAVQDSFYELLDRHNAEYVSKIERITRHYLDVDSDDAEYNEVKIYIGKELFYNGKGPDLFETYPEMDREFYQSIVPITEGILNAWHEKIMELQEENQKKVQEFEEEGYHEFLYIYYRLRHNSRAFLHLKKLAERYPNSKYATHLRRVYRNGVHYMHHKNPAMVDKVGKQCYEHENF